MLWGRSLNYILWCMIVLRRVVSIPWCFEELLTITQACDNKAIMYASLQGGGSGLGSEFNHFLVYSLINAAMVNKRLVYFASQRKWEYDCPQKNGWGCYFEFPCNLPNGANHNELDFTDERSSMHDRDHSYREYPDIFDKIKSMYDQIKSAKNGECKHMEKDQQTILTSIAAKHLYKLNPIVRQFVNRFNDHYAISGGEYLALQIRAQDKRYEMSAEMWEYITNVRNIYNEISPYLYGSPTVFPGTTGYKMLFVSTDNCTMLAELGKLAPPDIVIMSPCHKHLHPSVINLQNDGEKHNSSSLVGDFNPRLGDYKSTLRLFAEIEMLAGGTHFFGIMNSNLVRMVHRLRYPDKQSTTHGLAYNFTSSDFRCRYDTLEY